MRRAVIVLALVAGTVVLVGCATAIRNQARETAAKDHQCPLPRVQVVSDASAAGMDYSFWLRVCGKKRLYRYSEEGGKYSGRFVDVTRSVK